MASKFNITTEFLCNQLTKLDIVMKIFVLSILILIIIITILVIIIMIVLNQMNIYTIIKNLIITMM